MFDLVVNDATATPTVDSVSVAAFVFDDGFTVYQKGYDQEFTVKINE